MSGSFIYWLGKYSGHDTYIEVAPAWQAYIKKMDYKVYNWPTQGQSNVQKLLS